MGSAEDTRIDLHEIARLRLRNQRIATARLRSPVEVVSWLGAVQSQEYGLARWSVGMRTSAENEAEVESAVARGAILRTHVLRPTWHFILPRDIRAVMRLTAQRWSVMLTRRHGQLGLDARQVARGLDSIQRALAGGASLTRQELGAAIERDGVNVDGQRLAFIVMAAETGLIVASGKPKGALQTYALLDERAPEPAAAPFDRDQALADLVLRYFTSHGPATLGDFTWWSSLTVADARRGLAAHGAALEKLTVDGVDHWWAGDTAEGPDDPSPTCVLLQGFDEYVVGYRSPRTFLNLAGLGPHTGLGVPSWLHGVFLDGQLIGWWRRAPGKGAREVETKLLRDLAPREQSALQSAVCRYVRFVGK